MLFMTDTCSLVQLIISCFHCRYPNPSSFTYERRLFCPFEYALQPPPWYKQDHIAVNKPELPDGVAELKQYDGPQCFLIPGNHGWFYFQHEFCYIFLFLSKKSSSHK